MILVAVAIDRYLDSLGIRIVKTNLDVQPLPRLSNLRWAEKTLKPA